MTELHLAPSHDVELALCGLVGESVADPDLQEWGDRACPTCTVRKGWQSELNSLAVHYPKAYLDERIWRGWRVIAEPAA